MDFGGSKEAQTLKKKPCVAPVPIEIDADNFDIK
jgi:hypothetical protein